MKIIYCPTSFIQILLKNESSKLTTCTNVINNYLWYIKGGCMLIILTLSVLLGLYEIPIS